MGLKSLRLNITPKVIIVFSLYISIISVIFTFPLFAQNSPGQVELNEDSSLPDYLAYAALNNPGLKAAFYRWQAALERIPQVRSLPDPRFNFAYFIREVETRVGPQRQKVGITQMFPWFNKLKLRGNAAVKAAKVEKHHYDAVKLSLFHRIKEAYFEYYYVLRRVAILKESVRLLKHQDEVLQVKYRTGQASYAALLKLHVELDKLQERIQSAEAGLRPVKVRLNAVLNRPLHAPLAKPKELPAAAAHFSDESLAGLLKKNNPMLKSLDAAVEKEKINLKLAKRIYLPDFSLGVDYIITGETDMPGVTDSGKDPFAAMISVRLPLWFKKNRAAVKEINNRYQAALNMKQEEENKLLTRLELVVYRFRDAERKIKLYRDSLLPKAKQAYNVSRTAFEAGSADFLDFIDSQRTLLAFELEYERARTDNAKLLAELEMMLGTQDIK